MNMRKHISLFGLVAGLGTLYFLVTPIVWYDGAIEKFDDVAGAAFCSEGRPADVLAHPGGSLRFCDRIRIQRFLNAEAIYASDAERVRYLALIAPHGPSWYKFDHGLTLLRLGKCQEATTVMDRYIRKLKASPLAPYKVRKSFGSRYLDFRQSYNEACE